MEDQLEEGNLIFFGGKGGTGKTTCSAATGLHAAKKGLKTLIISVDNKEHSLGNSFDLDVEDGKIVKVKGVDNLSVYELNATKLFQQWAKENEDIQQILSMVYTDEKSTLAGSSEVLGLSEIYRLYDEGKYDVIIVDTAPTASALQLLDSINGVEKLMNNDKFWWAVDFGITWFKRAKGVYGKYQSIRRGLGKLNPFGSDDNKEEDDFMNDLNSKIKDISESLDADNVRSYLETFKKQVTDVRTMLQDKETTMFNIVSNPEQMSINESLSLYTRLHEIDMPVKTIVFNRVQQLDEGHKEGETYCPCHGYISNQVATQRKKIDFVKALVNGEGRLEIDAEDKYMQEIVREFNNNFSEMDKTHVDVYEVPRFSTDVHGMESLERVEKYMFGTAEPVPVKKPKKRKG